MGSSCSQLWTFQRTSHVNYPEERPTGLLSRQEATSPSQHRKGAVAMVNILPFTIAYIQELDQWAKLIIIDHMLILISPSHLLLRLPSDSHHTHTYRPPKPPLSHNSTNGKRSIIITRSPIVKYPKLLTWDMIPKPKTTSSAFGFKSLVFTNVLKIFITNLTYFRILKDCTPGL